MNIFILDYDPVQAARYCVDKHVSKMPSESCQMLQNLFSEEDLAAPGVPRTKLGEPRKHSYYNHPCSKWVRESSANAKWLLAHAQALCAEKFIRWPDKPAHFAQQFLDWCDLNINRLYFPDDRMTPFVLAMPDDVKTQDPVESYRLYYNKYKRHIFKWSNREAPFFIQNDN